MSPIENIKYFCVLTANHCGWLSFVNEKLIERYLVRKKVEHSFDILRNPLFRSIEIILIPLGILCGIEIVILKLGTFSSFFTEIFYIATAISEYTALRIEISRLVALNLIIWGNYLGLKYIIFYPKKKYVGYVSLVVVWLIMLSSIYAVTTTYQNFSYTNAIAQVYYFIDTDGQIVLRDHPGVDAESGTMLHPVTPEIIRRFREQQKK